jgi:NADPH:quinone reductase-like Zn-dependent oxidoreductase
MAESSNHGGIPMKAVVYTKYGSPDILQFTEVEKPTPNENQVLVKVYAASANPLDWHRMRGEPFLARMSEGFLKPKNPKLGADIAGRFEAVGNNVTEFKPGDEVFGSIGAGGFAEYVCAGEKYFALKPSSLSFEATAAAPVVGFTALQGLRDAGHIQSGQKVLVNGAAGGVGTFAVQIAKSYGVEVTGVCSTRNMDMMHSIGADHVIDYTQEDFTRNGQFYDLIYDAVGNRSVSDYKRALHPNGICVVAGFTTLVHVSRSYFPVPTMDDGRWTMALSSIVYRLSSPEPATNIRRAVLVRLFEHIVVGAWVSRRGSQKIGLMGMAKPNKEDLIFIKDLLESGKVVPVIDRRYPLSETAEAIRYLEEGHAQGKVIITVEQNNK